MKVRVVTVRVVTVLAFSILAVLVLPLNVVHGATITIPLLGGCGTTCSNPQQVAFDSNNGKLYVTNRIATSVNAICVTGPPLCTPLLSQVSIPLPYCANVVNGCTYPAETNCSPYYPSPTYPYIGPNGIAYSTVNHDLYVGIACGLGDVGGAFPGTVAVIDGNMGSATMDTVVGTLGPPGFTVSFAPFHQFTVGDSPFDIAFNPSLNMMYVANYGSHIWAISQLSVTGEIDVTNSFFLAGIAYDPAPTGTYSKGVCATDLGNYLLFCFTQSFLATCFFYCPYNAAGLPAGTKPIGIAISNNWIYVAEEGGTPRVCSWSASSASLGPCSSTLLPGIAYGVATGVTTTYGNKVYVTIPVGTASDPVYVFKPSPLLTLAPGTNPVLVQSYPVGITIAPGPVSLGTSCFYVANSHSDSVSRSGC